MDKTIKYNYINSIMYILHSRRITNSIALIMLFMITVSFLTATVNYDNNNIINDNSEDMAYDGINQPITSDPIIEEYKELGIKDNNPSSLELNNINSYTGSSYIGETLEVEIQQRDSYLQLDNYYNQESTNIYSIINNIENSYSSTNAKSYDSTFRKQSSGHDLDLVVVYDVEVYTPGTFSFSYRYVFDYYGSVADKTTDYNTKTVTIDNDYIADKINNNLLNVRIEVADDALSRIYVGGEDKGSISNPTIMDGDIVRDIRLEISYAYFVPYDIDYNLKANYEYASDSQIIQTIEIENYFVGSTITIYHNSKWDFFNINVESDITENINNLVIKNGLVLTYVVKFSYYVDNYAHVTDITNQFLTDPSFEQGNSVLDLSDTQITDYDLSTEKSFEGAQSIYFTTTSGSVLIPLESSLLEGDYVVSLAIWDTKPHAHVNSITLDYRDINNNWIEFWSNDDLGYQDKNYFNNIQGRFRVSNTSVNQLRINIAGSSTNTFFVDNVRLYQTLALITENSLQSKDFLTEIINIDGYQNPIVPYAQSQIKLTNLENPSEYTDFGIVEADENGLILISIDEELVAYNEYRIDIHTIDGNFDSLLRNTLNCRAYTSTSTNGGCSTDAGNLLISRGSNARIVYKDIEVGSAVPVTYNILENSLLYLFVSYRIFDDSKDSATFRIEIDGVNAEGSAIEGYEVIATRVNDEEQHSFVVDLSEISRIDEIDIIPQWEGVLTIFDYKILTHDLVHFTPIEAGIKDVNDFNIYDFDFSQQGWDFFFFGTPDYTLDTEINDGVYEISNIVESNVDNDPTNPLYFRSPEIEGIADMNELELRIRADKEYLIRIGNSGNFQTQTITTEYTTIVFDLSGVDFTQANFLNQIALVIDPINADNPFNSDTLIELDTITTGVYDFYDIEINDIGDAFVISSETNTLSYFIIYDDIPFYVDDLVVFEKSNTLGEHLLEIYIIYDSQNPTIIQAEHYVFNWVYTIFQELNIDVESFYVNDETVNTQFFSNLGGTYYIYENETLIGTQTYVNNTLTNIFTNKHDSSENYYIEYSIYFYAFVNDLNIEGGNHLSQWFNTSYSNANFDYNEVTIESFYINDETVNTFFISNFDGIYNVYENNSIIGTGLFFELEPLTIFTDRFKELENYIEYSVKFTQLDNTEIFQWFNTSYSNSNLEYNEIQVESFYLNDESVNTFFVSNFNGNYEIYENDTMIGSGLFDSLIPITAFSDKNKEPSIFVNYAIKFIDNSDVNSYSWFNTSYTNSEPDIIEYEVNINYFNGIGLGLEYNTFITYLYVNTSHLVDTANNLIQENVTLRLDNRFTTIYSNITILTYDYWGYLIYNQSYRLNDSTTNYLDIKIDVFTVTFENEIDVDVQLRIIRNKNQQTYIISPESFQLLTLTEGAYTLYYSEYTDAEKSYGEKDEGISLNYVDKQEVLSLNSSSNSMLINKRIVLDSKYDTNPSVERAGQFDKFISFFRNVILPIATIAGVILTAVRIRTYVKDRNVNLKRKNNFYQK